jgi:hypothetical protein
MTARQQLQDALEEAYNWTSLKADHRILDDALALLPSLTILTAEEAGMVRNVLRDRDEALTMLRSVWDHHMNGCTDFQNQTPLIDSAISESIREWMNAPSDTASADPLPPVVTRYSVQEALRLLGGDE